ncbi:MAG: DUF1848 domain-containing protein [Anaerolineales bacterium]|nr:DUF1848 domain-containing protein [Anaerolineales bacterium]
MIISASRRTDIPAFYAEWFIKRVRAGYCIVPNPFNPRQARRVSLAPGDVDVIVFWTRNPRPLFPYLGELDERGYRYYFHYTLMDNPRLLEARTPPVEAALETFRELAGRVGAQRVIWRYDPIIFSQVTLPEFHRRVYRRIAQALRGCTRRSVISILDVYGKIEKRMAQVAEQGAGLLPFDGAQAWFGELMRDLVAMAGENEMEIVSCAEPLDLEIYGIRPGKCVDDEYIQEVFGLEVVHDKDPGQRAACGCVISWDIGMYDSCTFGCQYCYATTSFERARRRREEHNPESPSLIGWYEVENE